MTRKWIEGDLPTRGEIEAILIELLNPQASQTSQALGDIALVRQLSRIELAIEQLTKAVESLAVTVSPRSTPFRSCWSGDPPEGS